MSDAPDFDVVVVGAGAGGGVLAGELARRGLRVLALERGDVQEARAPGLLEKAVAPTIRLNGRRAAPLVGAGPGGSTAFYGGVMLRPSPLDFSPGRFYSRWLPKSLWDWPIDYEALEPYYDRAERLFRVSGEHREPWPFLGRRNEAYPAVLPGLEPLARTLASILDRNGVRSRRLPLAIDWERCAQCPACPGRTCPTGARATSLVAAKDAVAPDLWRGADVRRIDHVRGIARAVEVVHKNSLERVTCRHVVLAAGALGTPTLLESSELAADHPALGRFHMCHLGVLAAIVFARPTGGAERFAKQIGFSDHYVSPEGHKLGYAQQIPVPEEALPKALRGLAKRSALVALSIEDLPSRLNRVSLVRGSVTLRRRFHRYDLARARIARRLLAGSFRGAGSLRFRWTAHRSHRHLAHQVGTCRFGRDPQVAVLGPDCRVHGTENVWVADGSFMPTSLGVGPALTIAANALRVADAIVSEAA